MKTYPEIIYSLVSLDEYDFLISIGINIGPILPSIKLNNSTGFIVRSEDRISFFPKLYGDSNKQRKYRWYMNITAKLGAAVLSLSKKGSEYSNLMDFCRLRRRNIAKANDQHQSWFVGEYRKEHARTPCDSTYSSLKDRFLNIYQKEPLPKSLIVTTISETYTRVENQFSLDGKSYVGNSFILEMSNKTVTVYHSAHSPPEDYYQNRIERAMAAASLEDLHQITSELFWVICAFKPFKLGDPSIAEALIRSIYFYKGYQMPNWKINIIPWVEATLCFDIASFQSVFINILDGDFIKLSNVTNFREISSAWLEDYIANPSKTTKEDIRPISVDGVCKLIISNPEKAQDIIKAFIESFEFEYMTNIISALKSLPLETQNYFMTELLSDESLSSNRITLFGITANTLIAQYHQHEEGILKLSDRLK